MASLVRSVYLSERRTPVLLRRRRLLLLGCRMKTQLPSPDDEMAFRDSVRLERQAVAALKQSAEAVLWGWVETEVHLRKSKGKVEQKWIVISRNNHAERGGGGLSTGSSSASAAGGDDSDDSGLILTIAVSYMYTLQYDAV
jgi:hypothetical protein|eukprot:COSAG01_NODE_1196_length_11303_cov_16.500714_13_plen_141_part_00